MSRMKSKSAMLFMLSMATSMDYNENKLAHKYTDEELEFMSNEHEKMKYEKFTESQKKKGLSLYVFGDIEIWALNDKNALRKLNKINANGDSDLFF